MGWWSTFASDSASALLPICFFHLLAFLVVRPYVCKRDETRWFFVHAALNAHIAFLTYPAVIALVTDPGKLYVTAASELTSHVPICVGVWMHVYHVTAYKLRFEDTWHHLLFVPTIGAPGYMYEWGGFGNLQLFFICGFPGAVIYSVLVLQRVHNVRLREPVVSAWMNVTLRAPGILVSNVLLLHAYANGSIDSPPLLFVGLQLVLAPTNGIYYAKQAWSRRLKKKDHQ